MNDRIAAVTAVFVALLLLTAVFAGGGLVMLLVCDHGGPATPETFRAAATTLVALVCVLLGVYAGRRRIRPLAVRVVILAGSLIVAVIAGELLCRQYIPAWPARSLHGVTPQEWAAATRGIVPVTQGPSINSWSQRDRARTLHPAANVRRIAFIGDSFLEEGAAVPVSLATEAKFGRRDLEVINLGVSASGPDEYYDRLRNVGGALGISHCCLFLFAGNDFVSPLRTLSTCWGIAAVEPRPAFLTSIGLAGWNHVLMNRRRPVIEAWMSGAPLAVAEQQRFQMLRQASDEQMRQMLLNAGGLEGDPLARLAERLGREDARDLFEMLRNPDGGKFRSYYLSHALAAASGDGLWEENSTDIAWHWTEAAARWCQRRGVGLTVVVIPEAFQVDERMREQWLPLADMRDCTSSCRRAAEMFCQRARAADLDVIDLHDSLDGSRGTYLNLDGHWSEAGVDLVATLLVRHLALRLTATGALAHESR